MTCAVIVSFILYVGSDASNHSDTASRATSLYTSEAGYYSTRPMVNERDAREVVPYKRYAIEFRRDRRPRDPQLHLIHRKRSPFSHWRRLIKNPNP